MWQIQRGMVSSRGAIDAGASSGTTLMALNDFEFGVNDELVTAAGLNGAEQGTAWTWTLSRTPIGHTRISTSGNNNFTLPANVNGAAIATDGTRRLKFNLTEGVSDGLTPLYDILLATPPLDIYRLVATGFVIFGATHTSGTTVIDVIELSGTPYVTMQLYVGAGAHEGTGGGVHVETQMAGNVTVRSLQIPVDIDTAYNYEMLWDGITGDMALLFRSSDQSTFIGAVGIISDAVNSSPLSLVHLQDYLIFEAGAIQHDKFARAWGAGVSFPLFPLTLPAPTSTVAVQEVIAQLKVTWSSGALAYTLERSSNAGASWSTLFTATSAGSLTPTLTFGTLEYIDTTPVDGVTYRYRVTAIVGSSTSSATTNDVTVDNATAAVAVDNFSTYVNAEALGTPPSDVNWEALSGAVTKWSTNKVSGDGGGVSGTAKSRAVFSANHRSEAGVSALSAGSFQFAAVCGRCQAGAQTFYIFLVDGTNWYLQDYISGTSHTITNSTSTIVDGDRIAINVSGAGSSTRITLQKYHSGSWSTISANIDPGTSHYIDGGAAGIGGSSGTQTVALLDNWKGFNL